MRKIVSEGKVALLSALEFINNVKESNNNSPINLLARLLVKQKGGDVINFQRGSITDAKAIDCDKALNTRK